MHALVPGYPENWTIQA